MSVSPHLPRPRLFLITYQAPNGLRLSGALKGISGERQREAEERARCTRVLDGTATYHIVVNSPCDRHLPDSDDEDYDAGTDEPPLPPLNHALPRMEEAEHHQEFPESEN